MNFSLWGGSFASRKLLSRWLSWFAFINAIMLAFVAIHYSHYMPNSDALLVMFYRPLAMIGHFGLLAYLLAAPLYLLLLLSPQRWLVIPVAVSIGAVGLLLLKIDTLVYAQYRFHISGFVIDMALNAGNEIFDFSVQTWLMALLLATSVLLVEMLLAWWLWRRRALLRYARWAFASIMAAFVVSQSIHAWADANYERSITRLTRHIPAYHPTTARDFFQRYGWVDMEKNRLESELVSQTLNGGDLNYPAAPLQCQPADKKPNLLFVVIDSWRADTFSSAITPNIQTFSEDLNTDCFLNHFSGGNSTRSGIFSLFYALSATYWDDMYGNQVGPVLIDQLLANDYNMGIFASSKLTDPAFDRTVFSRLDKLRLSTLGDEPWLRDEMTLMEWADFLDNCQDQRPFFGFFFFDSVHGYSFPDNYPQPFQPIWQEVNHLQLSNSFDPEPYFNRYKVAIHYVDTLVGRVLDDLKQRQLLDNTVVVITSDHGEEFNDNRAGYWGHGSNFTAAQTHVPLLIHWPGRQGKTVNYNTSHLDLVPTLMQEFFHCDNPARDYSGGRSLFDESPRPWTMVGSYFNYGIVEPDRITVTYPTGNYEIVDLQNRNLENAEQRPEVVMQVLQEMTRFYRLDK